VAKNEDFCQFAKGLAMHIAALAPVHMSRDEVNKADLAEDINYDEYCKQYCLLEQPYVKDSGKTIQDLLNELIAKIGENIKIGRFARYKVGA
jgi:elongation factor Ts